jgi:hypothetical protein
MFSKLPFIADFKAVSAPAGLTHGTSEITKNAARQTAAQQQN